MKFARIDIETIGFVNHRDKFHINFGDHLQNIIIKDLYQKMGISEEDIYVLNFNEISTYDGEYLILPINQAISHGLNSFISSKIIPVFLGISRDITAITPEEERYLNQYAPIGCRDEAIFSYLKKKNIECYLNGCLTVTLERRKKIPQNGKVVIIEAPIYAIETMPTELKDNAIYLENTAFGTYDEILCSNTAEKFVRDRYIYLKENASLVVTSRMHIASPCIGMGIPVVLVRNSIDYRFSWIDKYIPIYTPADAGKIDWNPGTINLEGIKHQILSNAANCIKSTYERYRDKLSISEFYENRKKVVYDLPHFSDSVIDFVTKKWSKNETWSYAIWGQNDASERLYQYLKENYPLAQYVAFYDSYKKITYHGRKAQHPSTIDASENIFIFVTGYTATDAAKELFEKIHKPTSMYYLFGKVVRNY